MENPDAILTSLMVLTYAMIGLFMGSFSGAIAHRIALGLSWIFDRQTDGVKAARSFCPSCHHQLSRFDLIPLFSWLFLGGKCRYCHVKIPKLYPLIEAAGAGCMVLFFLMHPNILIFIGFVITLPFFLTMFLLCCRHVKAPIYVYVLFFSHIFVWLYAVIYGREAI